MHVCVSVRMYIYVKTMRFTFGIWNWNLFLGAFLLGGRGDDRYDGVFNGKWCGQRLGKIDASLGQVNSLP